MDFNDMYAEIDNIAEAMHLTDRQKLDELLRMDAAMYVNLGMESTKEERSEVKGRSRLIYRTIKAIDIEMGDLFLRAMRNESN
tara:strand:+ start:2592 stop:2840 length:249 start_codon:yes stop_codon:yes gene_type:complete